MRAVRFHDYQGLDGVRLEEVAPPAARPGEILVRVHAAGVNPFDWYAVEGYVNAYVQFSLPAILGRDFCGVVAAKGPDTSGFAVGDAVFGHADAQADGTFAEYVSVPIARAARKPDLISHVEAASLPNVLMAAWNGLFSAASGMDLRKGQTVLINGAAGGIGSVAVQLARWRGARSIGTASARNLDFLRELGVAGAFDYASNGWERNIGPVDAVLNTADSSSAGLLCSLIRPGGRYIGLRGLPPAQFVAERASEGIQCLSASGPATAHEFPAMAAAVCAGAVKPIVSATYPLTQFRRALEEVRGGHVRGKVVLEITS
jgi:NADPH:quinone reductase-like Zn-dependent oxidoreductase